MDKATLKAKLAALTPEQRQAALAKLEAKLAAKGDKTPKASSTEKNTSSDKSFPSSDGVSNAQARLWVFERVQKDSTAYNIVSALHMCGIEDESVDRCGPDINAIEWAVEQIVLRHEILRTRFFDREGLLKTEVMQPAPVKVAIEERPDWLLNTHFSEIESQIQRWSASELNLHQPPLLKLKGILLADGSLVLVMLMHHILADGWSLRLFEQELSGFYRQYVNGERTNSQPLSLQYRHYVGWQAHFLGGSQAQEQINYWKSVLKDAPARVAFPVCQEPLPEDNPMATRSYVFDFSPQSISALEAYAQAQRLSPFMVLLAAFKIVLSHYTGEQDLVVGTPVANRNRSEFSNNIGLFSNSVALRTRLLPDTSIGDFLATVKKASLEGYANQELPFEKVVDAVGAKRIEGQSPVFQVLFALQATEESSLTLPGVKVSPIDIARHSMEFPLMAELFLTPTRSFANFTYQIQTLSQSVMEALAELFGQVLDAIVQGSTDTLLSDLLPLRSLAETPRVSTELAQCEDFSLHEWQQKLSAIMPCKSTGTGSSENSTIVDAVVHLQQRLTDSYISDERGFCAETGGRVWSLDLKKLVVGAAFLQQHFPIESGQSAYLDPMLPLDTVIQLAFWLSASGAKLSPQVQTTRWQFTCHSHESYEHPVLVNSTDSNHQLRNNHLWTLPHGGGLLFCCKADDHQVYSPYSLYLRNPLGQALSHGLAGELMIIADTHVSSGFYAVEQADNSFKLVTAKNVGADVWLDGQFVSLEQMQYRLMQLEGIERVYVYVRRDMSGKRHLIGQVVPSGNRKWADIQAACQQWLDTHSITADITISLLTGIAYDDNGQVLTEQLNQFPVLDVKTRQELTDSGANWFNANAEFESWKVFLKQQSPDYESVSEEANQYDDGVPSLLAGTILPDELPRSVATLLRNAARDHSNHGIRTLYKASEAEPFELGKHRFYSYANLLIEARKIAAGLNSSGISRGDIVMLQLRENHHMLLGFWGCVLAGAAVLVVETPDNYSAENDSDLLRVQHALSAVTIKAVILEQGRSEAFNQALPQNISPQKLEIDSLLQNEPQQQEVRTEPSDPVLLMLTSGSTGKPKIVVQNHLAICSHAEGYSHALKLNHQSTSFNWMPLHHVGGIVMSHTVFTYIGANQLHADTQSILQAPLRLLDVFSEYQIKACWCPNFAFALINDALSQTNNVKANWDLSQVDVLINAGEAVVQTTAHEFVERLAEYGLKRTVMCPVWGMSETCSGVLYHLNFDPYQAQDSNYVSVGKPVKGVAIRIVDQNDKPVGEGKSGRLQVQGNVVLRGYYNNPEVNQVSYTSDGWFNTGDLAVMKDGQIAIVGREKDLIIINGRNFHGLDIELCVESLPEIAESHCAACAVRRPGDNTDQLCVFYSRQPGASSLQLNIAERIRRKTADVLGVVPAYVICLNAEDIPRTAIGKIQRSLLAQQFTLGLYDHLLETESGHAVPKWFHQPKWVKEQRYFEVRAFEHFIWIAQDIEQANQIAKQFDFGAGSVISSCDYASLGAQLKGLSGNIQLLLCDYFLCGNSGGTASDDLLDADFSKIWQFFQSLAEKVNQSDEQFLNLSVVTNMAYEGTLQDPLVQHPGIAGLTGFLASVSAEYKMPVRQVNVLHDGDLLDGEVRDNLVGELSDPVIDLQVILQSTERAVQRLLPVFDNSNHSIVNRKSSKNGIQVLLGGLGGIGLKLSRYLLQQGQGPVVALGRRPLAEVLNTPSVAEQYMALSDEFSLFHYMDCDLADPVSLSRTFKQIERDFNGCLSNVYHLIGVDRPAPLSEMSFETVKAILVPKVQGGRVLAEALESWPDVTQVHFSSVAGMFGGRNYAAYALANGVQAAWCQQQKQLFGNYHCLLWSMWQDTGMAIKGTNEDALRHAGYHVLTPELALDSFSIAVQSEMSNEMPLVCIGLDDSNPQMFRHGVRPSQLATLLQVEEDDLEEEYPLPETDSFGSLLTYRHSQQKQTELLADLSNDRDYLALKDIWQRVLNRQRVEPQDNFFALGGDSILAIQCVSQAAQEGIALQPRDLFQAQTLSQLVACCKNERGRIKSEKIEGELALMPMQQWFFEQQFKSSFHFNQSVLLKLNAPLDMIALQQALEKVSEQHDLLRARFSHADGLQQTIEKHIVIPVEQTEFLSMDEIFECSNQIQAGLNLETGPLIQVLYMKASDIAASRLLIVVHHLLIDGVSWRIFLEDLERLYRHFALSPQLEAPTIVSSSSIRQWQDCLRDYLNKDLARSDMAFWQRADLNVDSLPLIPSSAPNLRADETYLEVKVSAEQTRILFQDIPFQQSLKADDLIISALSRAYVSWRGGNGMSLLMEGHGRELPIPSEDINISRTLGWFTAFYPLHVSVDPAWDLAQQIYVTSERRAQIPDGGVSFNLLKYMAETEIRQLMTGLKMPQISYNYLGRFDMGGDTLFQFAPEAPGHQVAPEQHRPNELDIVGRILDEEAVFSFVFSDKRYDADDISRLVSAFENELLSIVQLTQEQWQKGFHSRPLEIAPQVSALAVQQVSEQEDMTSLSHLLPAASVQVGVLFEALVNRIGGVYVSQLINQISGNLHVENLRRAWQQVIDEFAIYRTGFYATTEGEYLQLVYKRCELPFTYEDWSSLSDESQEQKFETLLANDRDTGFDFAAPPLMRIHLVRMGESRYRLLLSEFHAVADGWSRGLVLATVVDAYRRLQAGKPLQSPKCTQFYDYQRWFARQDLTPAQQFWAAEALGEVRANPLFCQRVIESAGSAQSKSVSHEFDTVTSEAVENAARACKVTLNAVMQSAWGILLATYTQSSSVAFGTTHSGRTTNFNGIDTVVGPLINTLPVVMSIDAEQSIRDLLQNTQRHIMQLTDNGYLPLNEIAGLHGNPRLAEELNTLFVFENFPMTVPEPDEDGLTIEDVRSIDSTEYPLTLSVIPGQPIKLLLYFLDSHFSDEDITNIAQQFERLTLAIVHQLDDEVGQLEWLSAQELSEINQRLAQFDVTYYQIPAEPVDSHVAQLADVEDLEF